MNFILDIDGTLWDTTEVVANAWNDAVEEIGLADKLGRFITADQLKREFGKPMDVIIADVFPMETAETREKALAAIIIHEQKAVKETSIHIAFPKIKETMEELVGRGHRLFIVSNCQDGYIELVMEKLSITNLICDFESFGRTGLSKAENIQLVMNRNRFAFNDSCYVGDTFGDYQAACEVQIPFIYASYGFGDMPDDYNGAVISAFEDLLSITASSFK